MRKDNNHPLICVEQSKANTSVSMQDFDSPPPGLYVTVVVTTVMIMYVTLVV